MSLKVIVPRGQTEITVNGLHQWDFGRTIEIHADGLPPAVAEVHFACAGMNEAVVRACAVVEGVVTAAVPDMCLEQTTPIVAWVYAVGETTGATILTITLPITPRTRPQPSETIPENVSDKYTEAVAAMNTLVEEFETVVETAKEDIKTEVLEEFEALVESTEEGIKTQVRNGEVVAGEARHAAEANTAARLKIGANYTELEEYEDAAGTLQGGLISFKIQTLSESGGSLKTLDKVTIIADVAEDSYSPTFYVRTYTQKNGETLTLCRLHFDSDGFGEFHVRLETMDGGSAFSVSGNATYRNIYYKYLSDTYPVG